ncbi:MAG TPA: DUF2723 domain-containing protein [Methylomirabilota bacterium]|nr:DUF2723 domain-containing protein [Methylomirabilota bacterium]
MRLPATDWSLALGLAVLTVATRIPVRARILPTWDAVQFGLALAEYDVVKHQPHPPGYLLFVGLGRVLTPIVGDAAASLTWLAIGASGATVLAVYALAWRLGGRGAAVVAASALAASPLFWFHGVVGLSYAAEAALATGVASLAWAMRRGRPGILVGAAVALGLAGGVRQSILLLLLPLWVGMAWLGFRRWRPVLGGLTVVGLTVLTWLVPMMWLSGGPAAYLRAARELYGSTVHATTLLGGHWLSNVDRLAEAGGLGLGLFLPVAAAALVAVGRRAAAREPEGLFFALWLLPPVAVYATVHLGQSGYLLTVLPACYVLIGLSLTRSWATGRSSRRWGVALVAGGVVAHAAFFTLAGPVDVAFPAPSAPWRERWVAAGRAAYRFRIWAHTAAGLREREAVIAAYVGALRTGFDPTSTVVVTEVGNPRSYPWFRHVMYYAPEFPVYHLRRGGLAMGYVGSHGASAMAGIAEAEIVLPPTTRRLVWVVDAWDPAVPVPRGLSARLVAHGRWLYVLPVDRRPVEHDGYRLTPQTALARLR